MNREAPLIGEVPKESEVGEGLRSRMSALLDGVSSCQHPTELHCLWRRRKRARPVFRLACTIVKNAAVEGKTHEAVSWFIFKYNVSAVEFAVQEQFDTRQLFEPAFEIQSLLST